MSAERSAGEGPARGGGLAGAATRVACRGAEARRLVRPHPPYTPPPVRLRGGGIGDGDWSAE
eukprot:761666-Prorocentrum_minimum.AAC.2